MASRSPIGRPGWPPPRRDRGDAQLGTLAGSVPGCVAAVGPGAALAAAKPDGSLARYQTAADFVAGGMKTDCPITLVDAGELSSQVITGLAADDRRHLDRHRRRPAAGIGRPEPAGHLPAGTTLPGLAHLGQHPAGRASSP